jgi:hypothetical protein
MNQTQCTFEVTVLEYGLIVRGKGIPIDEFAHLSQRYKNGLLLPSATAFYGPDCILVMAKDKKSADAWCAFIEKSLEHASPREQWRRGLDWGKSSLVIFNVFVGAHADDNSLPRDSSDFGRCYRLLEKFPEWRPRLDEVATRHPRWSGIVERWSELENAFASGDMTSCNAILDELNGVTKHGS